MGLALDVRFELDRELGRLVPAVFLMDDKRRVGLVAVGTAAFLQKAGVCVCAMTVRFHDSLTLAKSI